MRCKLCNNPVTNIIDSRNNWEFFHCKKCEFIFKNESDFVSREDELKQYNNHNNTMDSPGYVEMFEKFMDATFDEYIKDIKRVLEFGSGPGPVLSELLKNSGLNVDIYDKYFSPKKVYEGKKYDLITSTEVIEHIENPKDIFDFFASHIKKSGYLALMTQFHTNDAEDFKKWWYKNDPTHICFFRPHTFEVLAQKSGFKVLKHDSKKSILLQRI
ncbi:MAG: class I SAM-dependent methyltransferase [Thiovulaceae bacterium]|nr:class I SAM-dependent methyltransferase [Sulfurimonadaceae bacterium]